MGGRSPTLDLLVLFAVVFGAQTVLQMVGYGVGWFALAAPMARPWTLVTSVYAHAGVNHLLTNIVALVIIGFVLERFATRARFHAFVLVTGVLAGLAQFYAAAILGHSTAVIGASGAILALYGYALSGNPLTGGLLSRLRLGRRLKAVLVAAVAAGVTILTAGPGVALVAHFTGFVIGLVSGRLKLLQG